MVCTPFGLVHLFIDETQDLLQILKKEPSLAADMLH
jgi:hypothetical protein